MVDGAPTWAVPEDDSSYYPLGNTTFRLRVSVANVSITPTANKPWQLYVKKNGGTPTLVTTSSSGVHSADAGASTDEAPINNQKLTSGIP